MGLSCGLTLVGENSSLFELVLEGIGRLCVNPVVGLRLMLGFDSHGSQEFRKIQDLLRPVGLQ